MRLNHAVAPPPGPAPEAPGVAGASLRSLLALWELLPGEAGGPALAILLTSTILLTTLALYIAVCVAVFALF